MRSDLQTICRGLQNVLSSTAKELAGMQPRNPRQAESRQIIGRPECDPETYSLPVHGHLLDVPEAAARLNVPKSWIYQHVQARAEDKLPHFKVGKYIRFSAQALTQWLEAHRLGETASLVAQGGSLRGRRG